MELKTFISETLTSIVDGVKQAQAQHPSVAAEAYGIGGEQLKHGGTSGLFTIVEFDVAVSAETSAGGKAEIKVWGTGLGGGGERKLGHENRVKFAVHVKLPMGEKVKPQASSRDQAIGGPPEGVDGGTERLLQSPPAFGIDTHLPRG